jgi:hypothetical protein
MGSAPAWQRAGAGPCCRVAGKRAGSSLPSRCPRSTEAPDVIGAPPAGPPARARVRHSPLPHPWPPPPLRASRYDLDGQPNGPTTDGTHRPQVSTIRGGPQSSAAPTAGSLAAGDTRPATVLGSGYQSTAGGVRRELRSPQSAAPGVARFRSWYPVSCEIDRGAAAAPGGLVHSRIPARHLPHASTELPVYSLVLAVRARGGHTTRCRERHLAGGSSPNSLPSVSSRGIRSRPLMR